LLNLRWLTNASIVRLGIGLLLVRVVLSEQGTGAVAFLRNVGLNNDQMIVLFTIVLLATIAGIVVAATTTSLDHLLAPQVIALVIMALGAFIDSHSTNVTRPQQMYLSQAMMAFGGALFLGPLVVSLIGQVLANPGNLISFSVLFSLTQNLGGLIGSSLLGTFQVYREKFHSNILNAHLTAMDPEVVARLQANAGALGRAIVDPQSRTRQALAVLGASATREANILAYNDVFLMIAIIASLHAAWVFGRGVWLIYFAQPAAPAAAPAQAQPQTEQVTD
jgi:hypothetical protein